MTGDCDDLTSQGSPCCWELEIDPWQAAQLENMIGEDHGAYGRLLAVLDGPEGFRAVYLGGEL